MKITIPIRYSNGYIYQETFLIKFFHYQKERKTACRLTPLKDEALVTQYYAVCSRQDQYCKATGRKIALAKTIRNYFGEKEPREKFWAAYWEERKKVTKKPWVA